ncbi:hypothetical protein TRFO_03430 [Tritrichomonas foetus]|uniref:Uncharacterized protein n=1 Tax=Tritrichomonas foetus TaxID=1144522 RepID=A0A1J4KTM7_9EUKA|nr:hypothetical protein TRFO_03430 [Tritrichomonas foetus]|eukprot:OHT13022.1 hypothetical protein TRFO_03430 [Tritrichomonas foetus]
MSNSDSGSQNSLPDSPFFPISLDSPNTPRIHLDDVKQNRLDEKVAATVAEKGGVNYIQAEYVSQLCDAVIGSDNNLMHELQPRIKDLSPDVYYRALCLSLAFLKRYKMTQTVDALRKEFPDAPKSTGYSRASELDTAFEQLFTTSENSRELGFDKRARQFERKVSEMYEVAPTWLNDAMSVRSTRSIRSWKSARSAKSSKSKQSHRSSKSPTPSGSPSPRK